jgi:hypothetical protein
MVAQTYLCQLERPHATLEFMYCLRLRPRIKALALSNYDHELACGDVYIGFKRTGKLENWVYYPKEFEAIRLKPDRKAKLEGIRQELYLEIDRATEPLWKIEKKVENYLKVSEGRSFQVVFVAPSKSRAQGILGVLMRYQRGNQFLVSLQEWIALDPLAEIFVSPLAIEKKRFLSDLQ